MKLIPCEYNTTICPNCGNKARHPVTGLITPEKAEIMKDGACIISETIDEGRSTVGYHVICHNDREQNNEY